jgi:CDP-glucose 4,6-dehydratase
MMFNDMYQGKRVLITGHTGFKGSWLTVWLQELGAHVIGYALSAPTQPNHFALLPHEMVSIIADVRDRETLTHTINTYQPEIVFHLAAQPLVRYSYHDPVETFETNVMGTVNLLEACRTTASVKAIVTITSDKCYENKEWVWGYRENDPLGGYDPYSASKGCAELVTASYRQAFFPLEHYGRSHQTLIASCRAGNVIGGGDWGAERLIPDLVKAAARHEKVRIRSPQAIRPWQHVLDPLSGYLLLGQRLLEGQPAFAEAWNFGPADDDPMTVSAVVEQAKAFWPTIDYEIIPSDQPLHEANRLTLDCSKARMKLGWKPTWNVTTALEKTIRWYRGFYEDGVVGTLQNLKEYEQQIPFL